MTVCCQNLTLGALSSRSTLSVLVGALFEKFGLFLNTPRTCIACVVFVYIRQGRRQQGARRYTCTTLRFRHLIGFVILIVRQILIVYYFLFISWNRPDDDYRRVAEICS